jgi:hypothetical protein
MGRPPVNWRRKGHGGIAFALLALTIFLGMPPVTSAAAGVQVRKVLGTATFGDPFVFDVAPSGAVLLLTRDNVFDAGAGKFLFGESLKNPAWLGFAGEKMQLIAGGALFIVDGEKPRQLLEIPLKQRIFAADEERTFISGVTAAGKPTLFIYKEDAGYKALFELDAPIDAMALARGALFFSAGPRIYTLREGRPAKLLAHLPNFSHIPALAVDDKNGVLYFSEGDHLYALRGNDFVVVRRNVGGMLRWRNDSLYVLSWRDHVLLRMEGLAEAMGAAGALVPLVDPCRPPVLSLYCEAEEKRTLLKAVKMYENSLDPEDAARNELGAYAAEQKKALEGIGTALEQEAALGAQAVLWGGGLEPKAIRAKESIATTGQGVGLNFWNGSGIRIGPDSKLIVDDCPSAQECRLTFAQGLMYFEPYQPPIAGMTVPTSQENVISTVAMSLRFSAARFVLFSAADKIAIVVLEGRVKGVTPDGAVVILASGETLEAQRGERLGSPMPAELERLNKWWEEIR